MSFIDKLRMNNIFSPDNQNPLGPPDMTDNSYNMAKGFIDNFYPLMEQTKNNDLGRQLQVIKAQQAPQLAAIANSVKTQPAPKMSTADMPTYYKDNISDFQKAQLGLQRDKLNQAGQIASGKQGVAEGKNDISQQRANIYDFKSTHPNMKIEISKGGNFVAIDPITGKAMDTGISTGTMTDADKMKATGQNQINAIDERGDTATDLQSLRGDQSLANIAARSKSQKQPTTKTELPSQTKTRQNNAARQLMNSNPDLAPFINIDPTTGSFTVTPPSTNWYGSPTGPNADQFKKINDSIFGSTPDSTKPKVDNDPLGLIKKDDEDEG